MGEISVFEHTALVALLLAWLKAQPDGLCDDSVDRAARQLGLSRPHLWSALGGKKRLSATIAPRLVAALGVTGAAAEYVRHVVELHAAGPEQAIDAIRAVWRTYAAQHGLPWEDFAAMLAPSATPEATRAALVPALQAIGPELPASRRVAREAFVALDPARVQEAIALLESQQGLGHRLAPGLVELPPPALRDEAVECWSGALGWAREAMLRVQAEDREMGLWIWSADELAVRQVRAARRRLLGRLTRLARAHASAPAERVYVIAAPCLTLSEVWSAPRKVRRLETDHGGLLAEVHPAKMELQMGKRNDHPSWPLYTTLSFPEALAAWRLSRPRNQSSDAWIARKIKKKRSYVNDLALGRNRFRLEHVPQFLEVFELEADPDAAAWLEGLARLDQPLSDQERVATMEVLRGIAASRGVQALTADQLHLHSRWYVAATYALSFLPGFRAVPMWVARALRGRISARAAREALETLARLGMLTAAATEPAPVHLGQGYRGAAAFVLYEDALRLLDAELDLLGDALDLQGWTLALPRGAWSGLRAAVLDFGVEVRAVLEAGDARAAAGQPPDRVLLTTAFALPVLTLTPRPLRS